VRLSWTAIRPTIIQLTRANIGHRMNKVIVIDEQINNLGSPTYLRPLLFAEPAEGHTVCSEEFL
jgi:hypothetical protein